MIGLAFMGIGLCRGEPLISSHSTVVLLCGLPGDAESESTYRDQLQSWLVLLADHFEARRCVVYCDQPAAVPSSSGFKVQAIKGDREHFLTLPASVESTNDPLVVIVWGHGGNQGSTPVFHVRGPRLTPEDFGGVAARLRGAHGKWILLFRGSGAFARALSGPAQEVLSSDDSTVFSNDPASVPLLVKLVKENSNRSFVELAERFGRATADWYEARHLARTEEPTFWSMGQPARRLAEVAARSETSEPVSPEQEFKAPAKPSKAASSESPPLLSTHSTATLGWDQIKKVETSAFPDADAVVLLSRQVCALGSNPALVTEREEFIQVLRPEGKRFGDFDISFEPPHEELEFLACEVLSPDGQLVGMDPDGIGVEGDRTPGDYQTDRRKFFSLPGVVPGAVLHIRYRSRWQDYPLPHFSLQIPVARALPIVAASLEVRLPKEWPFHFGFHGLTAPEPKVTQSAYAASYNWNWTGLSPDLPEPLSAPARRPGLSISTFKDWQEFADWYWHITRLADEVDPQILAKASELTRRASTEREKVRAIYDYVTGLRYVAVPLGINSVRPHAAANVLKAQFGDCKDKANLLNTLLHALDIRADLVLVPRFSQADEGLPGLAFNHAISRVSLAEETIWLDSTDEVCRFGLLPPGDAAQNVLVVDGHAAALTPLLPPGKGEHRLSLRGQIAAGVERAWSCELRAIGSGCVDYQLRNEAQDARPSSASMALLEARYRPVAGSFALERQGSTLVSAMDRDFSWWGKGSCIGLAYIGAGQLTVHSPFWLPREWQMALNTRHTPLFLNEGYSLQLDEQFDVALPTGTYNCNLPEESGSDQDPLRWNVKWGRADDGKLTAHFRAELVQGALSWQQTTAFQKQLRELLNALASDAQASRPSTQARR